MNAECHPQRLGAKHLRILSQQLGIPSWGYPNTFNVQGRWYLIAKPEHVRQSDPVPFEIPESLCPYCGGGLSEGESQAMTPLHCASCDRTGWVYDEFLDADKNWDYYMGECERIGITDPKRAYDEFGIPEDVALSYVEVNSG